MKKIYLVVTVLLYTSCATTIVRWPGKSDEQQSRSLEKVVNKSIFKDFLWTTPPISSREIEDKFEFGNEEYWLQTDGDHIIINKDDNEYRFNRLKSDGTIYPNTDYLEPTYTTVKKWVPITKMVTETVPVHKTRTVPVTSFNADGTTSTSFQTETYVDHETRFVTKTEWEWQTHTELSYTIPDFDYYDVEIGNIKFYIYQLENKYYLQNPSYILCKEMNESFWGKKEVNLLFIDSNANGLHLEAEDQILFNIWNPYDPDSSYGEISHLMDNKWYFIDVLQKELYLDFYLEDKLINISYLNEEYIGNENSGTLTVNGIKDLKAKTYVNGKKYGIKESKPFNIEYGQFNIKISVENHTDYFDSFTIDENNMNHIINYEVTAPAALLKIENIFSNNYFVSVSNDLYSKTYYKLNEINIPYGVNQVEISVNGFTLKKTLSAENSEKIIIDFEKEIQNMD